MWTNVLLISVISGITNWKKLFILWSRKLNVSKPEEVHGEDAHALGAPNLLDLSEPERRLKLTQYTRVVFVRDPLTRLLSAYLNKFAKRNPYFHERYGVKILKHFRQMSSAKEENSTVQFEEFLQYLFSPVSKLDINEHWYPYHKICRPCVVKYDYIGLLENLPLDVRYLSDRLGFRIDYPDRRGYSSIQTHDKTRSFYELLPKPLFHAALHWTAPDYNLFGLHKPSYMYRSEKKG